MNKITIILLIATIVNVTITVCFSQDIYNMKVNEVYIDSDELVFQNIGYRSTYKCDPVLEKLNDNLFKFDLDCWEDNRGRSIDSSKLVKFNRWSKFESAQQFLKFIRNKRYEPIPNENDRYKREEFLQHLFKDYFVLVDYYYESDTSKRISISDVDVYNSYVLNINDLYYALVLIDIYNEDIGGFIIPIDEKGVASEVKLMKYAGDKINDSGILNRVSTSSLYTIRQEGDGYYLSDRIFNRNLLDSKYDTIQMYSNFIICRNGKVFEIYDNTLTNLNLNNVKAVYGVSESLQILMGDKLVYVNKDYKVSDKLQPHLNGVCGTVNHYEREIKNKQDHIVEIAGSGLMGVGDLSTTFTTSPLTYSKLLYLNGTKKHSYTGNTGLSSIYSNPLNLYYFESQDQVGLLEVTKTSQKYDFKEVLSLKGAEIYLKGYHQPIVYKSNGLYGVYSVHKNGVYTKLEEFQYFFAKFEKEGKTGFVDIYGNEYLIDN